jgi:tripartite-type tricarboxylate transporter receptor subunit TctC
MHPSSHIRALALALAICLPIPQAAAQDAVADFYRGKQLTIMVGFGPGGSASLYAQALAHHMGRHLPGNPGLIVQHAPGAGGLVVAIPFTTPHRATAVFSRSPAAPSRLSRS